MKSSVDGTSNNNFSSVPPAPLISFMQTLLKEHQRKLDASCVFIVDDGTQTIHDSSSKIVGDHRQCRRTKQEKQGKEERTAYTISKESPKSRKWKEFAHCSCQKDNMISAPMTPRRRISIEEEVAISATFAEEKQRQRQHQRRRSITKTATGNSGSTMSQVATMLPPRPTRRESLEVY